MPEVQGQEANNSAGAENQQGQEQQGGSAQGQQQQAIDWAKVDAKVLPEDVVKQSPAYKSLLSESVERRQQIKSLREQLETLEGDAKKPIQQQAPQQGSEEVPAWAKGLIEDVKTLKTATGENARSEMVNAAIAKHNLPKEAHLYIQGSDMASIEASAAGLVPLMVAGAGSAGNPGAGNASGLDSLRARIQEKVRGNTKPIADTSIFDVGVQRQKGGGGYFVSKDEG